MMPKSTTASAPLASTKTFPGCRSAWKKPSRNTWLKNDAAAFCSRSGIECPAAISAVAVIDPDAGDAFGRQHRAPGAPPIDLRHPKGRVAGEILGEFGGRGGLEAQIHFELHRFGEGHHHLDRLQPAQRRRRALDQLREPQKQFEVAREGAGDAGAQHLDRDRAAVGRDREMNLRDRRRGGRHIVERREERVERPAELGLDQRARLFASGTAAAGPATRRGRRRSRRPADRRGSRASARA